MRMISTFSMILLLAACGGSSNDSEPSLDQVRMLTNAELPAETASEQGARAPDILSRADSVHVSAVHGETSSQNLPTLELTASCEETTCTFTEPNSGISQSVSLSDLASITGNSQPQPIGTKHGITVIRSSGSYDGRNFRTLGAWMEDSAFAVQTQRFTFEGMGFEGIEVDARYGMAGGDLTRSRPTGDATWRGLMVGTPKTGDGRGDRLQGDAELTYSLDAQTLGASFTDIQNIDRLRAHAVSTVSFTGVPVDALGQFEVGSTGDRIQGGFYGTGHAETAGVFEKSNIVGAFGAKRQ